MEKDAFVGFENPLEYPRFPIEEKFGPVKSVPGEPKYTYHPFKRESEKKVADCPKLENTEEI